MFSKKPIEALVLLLYPPPPRLLLLVPALILKTLLFGEHVVSGIGPVSGVVLPFGIRIDVGTVSGAGPQVDAPIGFAAGDQIHYRPFASVFESLDLVLLDQLFVHLNVDHLAGL